MRPDEDGVTAESNPDAGVSSITRVKTRLEFVMGDRGLIRFVQRRIVLVSRERRVAAVEIRFPRERGFPPGGKGDTVDLVVSGRGIRSRV